MTHLTDVLVSLSPTAAILLKITILLVAGWAVHALLRISRADARWRLLLWRGVMAGLLLVPIAQWAGPWNVFVTRPAVSSARPIILTRGEVPSSPVQPIPSAGPTLTPAPRASIVVWVSERNPQLLIAFWFAAACFLLLRLLVLLARVRRIELGSRSAAPSLVKLLERVAREMGCRRPVGLRFACGTESPFLTGLWKPTIILPDRIEDGEYAEDLPAIMAHEVAHIREHDLWWMAVGRFVSTLLWFHPFVWPLRGAHTAACEAVCDAAAAQYVGNPAAYTSTLARVALAIVSPVPSAGGIPMARSSQIISRLRQLERGVQSNPIPRAPRFLVAGLGIAFLAALASFRLVYAQESAVPVAAPLATPKPTTGAPQSGIGVFSFSVEAPLYDGGLEYAIFDNDPIPEFKARLGKDRALIEGKTKDSHATMTITEGGKSQSFDITRHSSIRYEWDSGFAKVTGADVHLIQANRRKEGVYSTVSFTVSTSTEKWLVTKAGLLLSSGKTICWCVPLKVGAGENNNIVLNEKNALDLDAIFDEGIPGKPRSSGAPSAGSHQPESDNVLQQKLHSVSLTGVPLKETVRILSEQLGKRVNFIIEPKIAGDEHHIKLDLQDVTLAQALDALLVPYGWDYAVTQDGLYIGELSLRQYDVSDIVASMDKKKFIELLIERTGRGNWDYDWASEEAVKRLEAKDLANKPRLMLLRGQWLMVNNVGEIHKKIEGALRELREAAEKATKSESAAPKALQK